MITNVTCPVIAGIPPTGLAVTDKCPAAALRCRPPATRSASREKPCNMTVVPGWRVGSTVEITAAPCNRPDIESTIVRCLTLSVLRRALEEVALGVHENRSRRCSRYLAPQHRQPRRSTTRCRWLGDPPWIGAARPPGPCPVAARCRAARGQCSPYAVEVLPIQVFGPSGHDRLIRERKGMRQVAHSPRSHPATSASTRLWPMPAPQSFSAT